MIDTIEYKNEIYPKFQSSGFAARFAFPFALEICKGAGFDIGCNKIEWSLPNSIPIDLTFNNEYNALNLPNIEADYIFSSHCLEHIDNWVNVLNYWTFKLKVGGVLFLYLPDRSQKYWLPWNNRKHIHSFDSDIIYHYMLDKGYKNIFKSGIDLNNSFIIIGEKA